MGDVSHPRRGERDQGRAADEGPPCGARRALGRGDPRDAHGPRAARARDSAARAGRRARQRPRPARAARARAHRHAAASAKALRALPTRCRTSTSCRRCAASPGSTSSPGRRGASPNCSRAGRTTSWSSACSRPRRASTAGSPPIAAARSRHLARRCQADQEPLRRHGERVVVAITAGALREWLLVHDELPTDPLLAMIPVSVRLPEEFGTFGNRVSMMTVPIPTNEQSRRTACASRTRRWTTRRRGTQDPAHAHAGGQRGDPAAHARPHRPDAAERRRRRRAASSAERRDLERPRLAGAAVLAARGWRRTTRCRSSPTGWG